MAKAPADIIIMEPQFFIKLRKMFNNNNNNKDIYNAQIRRGSKCAVSGQY